jgi:catechol 2,3-dioxygenase-like lactoylglutathione lyase family enzyme
MRFRYELGDIARVIQLAIAPWRSSSVKSTSRSTPSTARFANMAGRAKENKMAKLRHIAITVPDPEKAAEFYERAFGLKRVGGTDWHGAHGVYLSDGVINLALLHYRKEEFAGERGRDFVGVHHFGFIVDDVAEARRRIEAAGGRHWMGEPTEGGGFYEVKYHDPDGVAFDITANGWTGAARD